MIPKEDLHNIELEVVSDNAEGLEIRYENDDTAFSIAFSREDRNELPLSGPKNGKINDHISSLEQTVLTPLRDDSSLTIR